MQELPTSDDMAVRVAKQIVKFVLLVKETGGWFQQLIKR